MTPQLQRRVQRYGWDHAMPHYENGWKQQLAPSQERLLALANLDAFERVLDVACGTGLITFPAAEQVGPGGKVFATDISDKMVDFVKQEARRRKLGQVVAKRAEAEQLNMPAHCFDAVLCSLGLMYVPDPMQALSQMLQVVCPGGRVVASVWGARAHCGWSGIFPVVDARVNTDVCPLFFQLGTQDLLAQAFTQTGFTQVISERISTLLHYPNAEAACFAAFVAGPVAMAYARFDEQTRAEAKADYLATIEQYRQGTGYAIPGEFVVVRGIKP